MIKFLIESYGFTNVNSTTRREYYMDLFKKLLSVLLIMAFLLQGFGVLTFESLDMQNVYAEDQNEVSQPIEEMDEGLKEIFNELAKQGIFKGYEDGTFRPDATITRAEFCAVVNRLKNLQDAVAADPGITPFNDVPTSHWAAADINVAYTTGIIKGYGDGRFGPEDFVTYEQVVTMLVRALGYEQLALERGTYPDGYLAAAMQIGILKGVTGTIGEYAKRGLVATITYNSMNINIPQQVLTTGNIVVSTDNVSRKFDVGNKRRDDYLEERWKTGIVYANSEIALPGYNTTSKNKVNIDGVIYEVGNTNIANFVGCQVDFRYRQNERYGQDDVIIGFDLYRTEIVIINAKDILNGTTTEKIVYWADREKDKEPTNASISNNPKIIYNGKPANLREGIFQPNEGSVKIIDNNFDGVYDVIFINNYLLFVVDSVSVHTKQIVPRFYENYVIDANFQSEDYELYIEKNGTQYKSLSAIVPGDVIAVAESENTSGKRLKKIYVTSKNVVVGTVEQIMESEKIIYIRGKNNIAYELANVSHYGEWPENGDTVELYLTTEYNVGDSRIAGNKIVGIKVNVYTLEGYLLKIDKDFNEVNFHIIDLVNKRLKMVKATSDIIIEEGGVKTNIKFEDIFNVFGGSQFQPQLVRYITRSQGTLKTIILAAEDLSGNDMLKYFSKDISATNARFEKAKSSSQADKFIIEGKSYLLKPKPERQIIFVPYGDKASNANNYKYDYNFVDGGEYSIDIYELDDLDRIGTLVLKETPNMPKQLIPDQPLSIVTDVSEAVHPIYGGTGIRVKYLYNGSEYSKFINEETVTESVYKDDIIQFTTLDDQDIGDVLVLTPKKDTPYYEKDRSEIVQEEQASGVIMIYGEVADVYKNVNERNIITVNIGNNITRNYDYTDARVYLYDTEKQKYITADKNAITKNMQQVVFIRAKELDRKAEEIVIINLNNLK